MHEGFHPSSHNSGVLDQSYFLVRKMENMDLVLLYAILWYRLNFSAVRNTPVMS